MEWSHDGLGVKIFLTKNKVIAGGTFSKSFSNNGGAILHQKGRDG